MTAKSVSPNKPCVCGSGAVFSACCGRYVGALLEKGAGGVRIVEPANAVELLRSRYASFALNVPVWLWVTLHPDNADRAASSLEAFVPRVREHCRVHRYMGLTVFDHAEDGDVAWALFRAKIFREGRDLSFVERSEFRRDAAGWRYLRGAMWPAETRPADDRGYTLAAFARDVAP